MTERTRKAGGGWRLWLPAVVGAWLTSRVVLVVVVAVVEGMLPLPWARPTYSSLPIVGGLTGHDAIYYLGIGAEGYHATAVSASYYDWVFFPAFPMLARLASSLTGGDIAISGVLTANVLLLAGMILVAMLIDEISGPETAAIGALLLAFAPGAVAFGMAYSDSLLLVAWASGVLAARRDRPVLAGTALAVATLARPPGILLALPLAVVLFQRRAAPRGWLPLALGPAALVTLAATQWAAIGDPLGFAHAQSAWNLPSVTAASSATAATTGFDQTTLPLVTILIMTLLAYTAMLPGIVRSRIPHEQVVVALIAFATVFISGRLQSDARYLAVGWPFAWYLAERGPRVRGIAIAVSAAAFALMAFLHVTQLLAP